MGKVGGVLLKAVKKGDLKGIQKELSSKKFDKDSLPQDEAGWNCWTQACLMGREDILNMLLEAGVNIRTTDGMGRSGLYVAAQTDNEVIASFLLGKGCDFDEVCTIAQQVTLVSPRDNKKKHKRSPSHGEGITSSPSSFQGEKISPIDVCIREKKPKVLKVFGAVLSKRLLEAVKAGEVSKATKLLARSGLDINYQDFTGWSALHLAMQRQDDKMVKLLAVNGADPTLRNKLGKTPLDIAKEAGNEAICRLFFEAKSAEISKKTENELEKVEQQRKGGLTRSKTGDNFSSILRSTAPPNTFNTLRAPKKEQPESELATQSSSEQVARPPRPQRRSMGPMQTQSIHKELQTMQNQEDYSTLGKAGSQPPVETKTPHPSVPATSFSAGNERRPAPMHRRAASSGNMHSIARPLSPPPPPPTITDPTSMTSPTMSFSLSPESSLTSSSQEEVTVKRPPPPPRRSLSSGRTITVTKQAELATLDEDVPPNRAVPTPSKTGSEEPLRPMNTAPVARIPSNKPSPPLPPTRTKQ